MRLLFLILLHSIISLPLALATSSDCGSTLNSIKRSQILTQAITEFEDVEHRDIEAIKQSLMSIYNCKQVDFTGRSDCYFAKLMVKICELELWNVSLQTEDEFVLQNTVAQRFIEAVLENQSEDDSERFDRNMLYIFYINPLTNHLRIKYLLADDVSMQEYTMHEYEHAYDETKKNLLEMVEDKPTKQGFVMHCVDRCDQAYTRLLAMSEEKAEMASRALLEEEQKLQEQKIQRALKLAQKELRDVNIDNKENKDQADTTAVEAQRPLFTTKEIAELKAKYKAEAEKRLRVEAEYQSMSQRRKKKKKKKKATKVLTANNVAAPVAVSAVAERVCVEDDKMQRMSAHMAQQQVVIASLLKQREKLKIMLGQCAVGSQVSQKHLATLGLMHGNVVQLLLAEQQNSRSLYTQLNHVAGVSDSYRRQAIQFGMDSFRLQESCRLYEIERQNLRHERDEIAKQNQALKEELAQMREEKDSGDS